MPNLAIHETRRLVVPLETAVDAVLQLDWEHGGRLADASLTEARIQTGDNPGLVLQVQRTDTAAPETRRFSLPAVAAAIISLCRKNRVPLPHSWPKKLEVVPGGFALSLEGSVQFARHHGPVPMPAPAKAGSKAAAVAEAPKEPVAAAS